MGMEDSKTYCGSGVLYIISSVGVISFAIGEDAELDCLVTSQCTDPGLRYIKINYWVFRAHGESDSVYGCRLQSCHGKLKVTPHIRDWKRDKMWNTLIKYFVCQHHPPLQELLQENTHYTRCWNISSQLGCRFTNIWASKKNTSE